MSGPKSYSPPPSYSLNVFNGKLNEIFQLQSKIKSLIEELANLSCIDNAKDIKFDCSYFIGTNRIQIENLLASFSIDHPGTFGQKVYDEFNRQIDSKIRQLKCFLEEINKEKKDFQEKKEDYQSFIAYENFYDHAISSFQSFKLQVIQYLGNYLKADYPELFVEAKESIEKVNNSVDKSKFKFGFRNIQSSQKTEIKNAIERCESNINTIRTELSDKVLDKIGDDETSVSKQLKSNGKVNQEKQTDIQIQIDKIKSYISDISDQNSRKDYQQKLENLINSSSFKDVYFYIELCEEIKEAEKIFSWKTEIQNMIAEINKIQIHDELQKEKLTLVEFGISLIEKERIKSYEFEDFQTQLILLREKNEKIYLEKSIKEKERLFLKTQLIKSLESLNYEVLDDMQVIDFEKETDFVLKIPRQSNYLNLRFQRDGSFLYNFLISQRRDELSIDQKQQKLLEMETTCKEFKNLLNDLESIGLKIDLNSEKPISEKALMQIPQKYQSKIKVTKTKKEKSKLQKERRLN